MQIGYLSRQTGVNIETIRYYERIGVLPKPARQPNGRRTYSPADAERLGFIRHARELGFDLPSIRILLALQERPEASCEDASRIAQEQLEAVESRIARLLLLQDELARMVSECRRGRVSECRVIEALAPARPTARSDPSGQAGATAPWHQTAQLIYRPKRRWRRLRGSLGRLSSKSAC